MSEWVEAPTLRQRFKFSREAGASGADVLHVDTWVDPGGGVTPHVHPDMEERFSVIEGEASFLAGRSWRTAAAGETVVVPAGTRHAYRNRGERPAHIVCEAEPPSTLQPFLEDTAALSRAGKVGLNGIPKGVDALLAGAAMAEGYRDMVTLGFPPMPPPALQRLLLGPLARLGERRGYRPGHFAEALEGDEEG